MPEGNDVQDALMSEEETLNGARSARNRESTSYEWLANRALGRARKILASNDGKPDPMADFLIASANVLATLELADAIRSVKSSSLND